MADAFTTVLIPQLGEAADIEATDLLVIQRGAGPAQTAPAQALMEFMEANGVGAANASASAAAAAEALEHRTAAETAAAEATAAAAVFSITTALKDWMRGEAYTITSTITRNAQGRPVSPLNIVWPDGGTGVLTINYNLDGTVAALSATHIKGGVTRTVAQPTITWSQGVPVAIPAITVT